MEKLDNFMQFQNLSFIDKNGSKKEIMTSIKNLYKKVREFIKDTIGIEAYKALEVITAKDDNENIRTSFVPSVIICGINRHIICEIPREKDLFTAEVKTKSEEITLSEYKNLGSLIKKTLDEHKRKDVSKYYSTLIIEKDNQYIVIRKEE